MLDIKFIRKNPGLVKEGVKKKQVKVNIDKLLDLDKKKRETLRELEKLRAEQNKVSSKVSREKNDKKKKELISRGQTLRKKVKKLEDTFKKVDQDFEKLMRLLPNLPSEGVPVGKDESDNVVLRKEGKVTEFDFKPKDHLTLGENLDLIDTKRAAKVSGSRFGFIKREAALIELGLINFALDVLLKEGFVLVIPPVLIKPEMMEGMGYLERGKEEMYFIEKDNLLLVGTSEQIIGPMHADEIFEGKELPKRYVGFSSCFRREAGSYGKDTRGVFRVHQFDKLEMFIFSTPKESKKEHEYMLSLEEKFMQALQIPYQVVNICSGDLGDPTDAKYDIEAWIPSQKRYRETHSTSNCTDFQARRLNIRFRGKDGKLHFVHTLNGTALAMGRMIIAIMENYQQKDGTILVPKVLQKYLGIKKISK
jgi:seryl-tRNA synthetase